MKRPNLRIVLGALVALVALGWAASSLDLVRIPNSFDVQSSSSMATSSGSVQLVVEYGQASGKANFVKSVKGFSGTGWQLLQAAGLMVQGTDEYPNSFVCRIDGWPTESIENCHSTPSANRGVWKYYITDSKIGSGWLLSGQGAAGRQSICGQAEAWVRVEPGQSEADSRPKTQPKVFACQH